MYKFIRVIVLLLSSYCFLGTVIGKQDYYKILGVSPKASVKEIRKKYKSLAKQWHPDKVSGDEAAKQEAQEKFIAINEAHEILSDAESRREYDQSKNDQHWRPQHNNFHQYHQQRYDNWRRAQFHFQHQHQYSQSPPSILATPMMVVLFVPLIYLIFSAFQADKNKSESRDNPNRSAKRASHEKSRSKKTKVLLTKMQEQQRLFAPRLVQFEVSGVKNLTTFVGSHIVIFLPSNEMMRRMARTQKKTPSAGSNIWVVLKEVAETFTRSDRILFCWTERSVSELRTIVQCAKKSFDLAHPDPAVLVLRRKKMQDVTKSSLKSSASAMLGGQENNVTESLAFDSVLSYVCPRHDRMSPKQFTSTAIASWISQQLCDGMASWNKFEEAPLILRKSHRNQ